MFVRQISVFVENVRGTLRKITKLIGDAGIDILALSVADTANFGIVRMIVREADIEKGLKVLKDAGCPARTNRVVCVCVPNRPSGLDEVLAVIDESDVSIEYLYSFNYSADGQALIIFRLSDTEAGAKLLLDNGIVLFTQEEVNAL
ncbi:MAG: ACT domain-containing protein [Lachnospiraceae bacterium]|nr:ACT domain-containing protein [Lachnospiraceae bacterium]